MTKHISFLIITIIYFITFLFGILLSIIFLTFGKIPKLVQSLGRVTEEAKDILYRNKEIPFDEE